MRNDQRLHLGQRKLDLQALCSGAIRRCLRPLKQPAVDEHRAPVGQRQLMTGPGDPIDRTMVINVIDRHNKS
jgi:hypothetical protein